MTQIILITIRRNNAVIAAAKVSIENYQVVEEDAFSRETLKFELSSGDRNKLGYDSLANEAILASLSNPEMDRLYKYATAMVA